MYVIYNNKIDRYLSRINFNKKQISFDWNGISIGAYIIDVEIFPNKTKAVAMLKRILKKDISPIEEKDLEAIPVKKSMPIISYVKEQ